MRAHIFRSLQTLGLLLICLPAAAGPQDAGGTAAESERACLLHGLDAADDELTIGELRARCRRRSPR